MNKLKDLERFKISKTKAKSIIGGYDNVTAIMAACQGAQSRANQLIKGGFYRCAGGCPEQDTIYFANVCAGRKPWAHEPFPSMIANELLAPEPI